MEDNEILEEDSSQYEEQPDDEELEEKEETETKKDSKKEKSKARVSKCFSDTIKDYLDSYAKTDEAFNERYKNPDKNINDCCTYILNQVKNSGCNGFADDEVFKMARDYYVDEIDPENLKPVNGKVVVNHHIELTEEEKEKARLKAIEEYKEQEIKRMKAEKEAEEKRIQKEQEKERLKEEARIKKEEEKKAQEQKAKEEALKNGACEQMSLFDMLGD